jgi:hypothetical protein
MTGDADSDKTGTVRAVCYRYGLHSMDQVCEPIGTRYTAVAAVLVLNSDRYMHVYLFFVVIFNSSSFYLSVLQYSSQYFRVGALYIVLACVPYIA